MGCDHSRNVVEMQDMEKTENPVLTDEERRELSTATKDKRSKQRLLQNMVHEEFEKGM